MQQPGQTISDMKKKNKWKKIKKIKNSRKSIFTVVFNTENRVFLSKCD